MCMGGWVDEYHYYYNLNDKWSAGLTLHHENTLNWSTSQLNLFDVSIMLKMFYHIQFTPNTFTLPI